MAAWPGRAGQVSGDTSSPHLRILSHPPTSPLAGESQQPPTEFAFLSAWWQTNPLSSAKQKKKYSSESQDAATTSEYVNQSSDCSNRLANLLRSLNCDRELSGGAEKLVVQKVWRSLCAVR